MTFADAEGQPKKQKKAPKPQPVPDLIHRELLYEAQMARHAKLPETATGGGGSDQQDSPPDPHRVYAMNESKNQADARARVERLLATPVASGTHAVGGHCKTHTLSVFACDA